MTWVPQLVLPLWFLSEALPQGAGSGWNHWSHQKHLDHPLQGQVRWAPQPGLPGPRHRSATPPSCGNGSSDASSPGDQCDTDGMTRDMEETQGFFGHREGRGDLPEAVTAQCQRWCRGDLGLCSRVILEAALTMWKFEGQGSVSRKVIPPWTLYLSPGTWTYWGCHRARGCGPALGVVVGGR